MTNVNELFTAITLETRAIFFFNKANVIEWFIVITLENPVSKYS